MSESKTTAKSIYARLQSVRLELSKKNLKKSGHNTFAKYDYFELGDFLPSLTELCEKHEITPIFNLGESATLTVINSDNTEESIVFTCPIAETGIKGCTSIQNLGGQITYLRRYLYQMAFEIAENDSVDAADPIKRKVAPAPVTTPIATRGQIDQINAEILRTGSELSNILEYAHVDSLSKLTTGQAKDIVSKLKQKPDRDVSTMSPDEVTELMTGEKLERQTA